MKLPVKQVIQVSMQDEVLTQDGVREIDRLLIYGAGLPPIHLVDWDWSYVVQKGAYRGNIVTRLSKYYSELGYELDAKLKSTIGNIVNKHRSSGNVFNLQFTKKLNWNAGEFGDRGSCFWGGRNDARRIMEENGVYAVKFFNNNGDGIGRCWMMKDRPEENCMIIWNGYGPSSWGDQLRQMSIVLSKWMEKPYKKIDLYNWLRNGNQDMLWINNFSGYIIGSKSVLDQYSEYDLELSDSNVELRCSRCRWGIRHLDSRYDVKTKVGNLTLCGNCYERLYTTCNICGERHIQDEMIAIEGGDEGYICNHHDDYIYIDGEGEVTYRHNMIYLDGDDIYIDSRYHDTFFLCNRTNMLYSTLHRIILPNGEQIYRGALSEEEQRNFGVSTALF